LAVLPEFSLLHERIKSVKQIAAIVKIDFCILII
jgi:hypothetical protein